MHQSPFSPFASATEVLDIVLSIKTDMALSNRGIRCDPFPSLKQQMGLVTNAVSESE